MMPLLPRRPVGVAVGITVYGTVEWAVWPGPAGPGSDLNTPIIDSLPAPTGPGDLEVVRQVADRIREVLPRRAVPYLTPVAGAEPVRRDLRRILVEEEGREGRAAVERQAHLYALYCAQELRAARQGLFCRTGWAAVLPDRAAGDPFTVATDGASMAGGVTIDGGDSAGWAFVTGTGLVMAGHMLGHSGDAELEAVCQAVEFFPAGARVTLLIDNTEVGMFVQECARRIGAGRHDPNAAAFRTFRWVTRDMHQRVYGLMASRNVHALHVKGHSGHDLHSEADRLARDVARRYHRLRQQAVMAAVAGRPKVSGTAGPVA